MDRLQDYKTPQLPSFQELPDFVSLARLWLLIGGAVMFLCSATVLAPVPATDSDLAAPSPDVTCLRDRYPPKCEFKLS